MFQNDSIPADGPPADGPFAPLRFREFRLFWLGQFISRVGDSMQQTAIVWLLYDLTRSPLQLGLNGAFRALPIIALGLFGGTIADRFDRKRILLCTQTTLMLLAFLLGFLAQTERIQVWHIYAFTLLAAIIQSVDAPSRQALIPSLVPRPILPNAVALNSLLWKGTILIGPSLAGIAISTFGTDGAFYANGISFLAVVLALMSMRISAPGAIRTGGFLGDLRRGLSYVSTQRIILAIMFMEAFSSLFGLDPAMITIFARDVLNAGASGLGFLQSARGLGAVLGSALLVAISNKHAHGKILLYSACIYGMSFALFGISPHLFVSLALIFLAGAADAVWGAMRSAMLQLQTPEQLQGRVQSVFGLCSRGLSPLGQVETGLVVPLIGAREATFFGGSIVLCVTLLTAWRVPEVHQFRERTRDSNAVEQVPETGFS
jgi:MFS family permease